MYILSKLKSEAFWRHKTTHRNAFEPLAFNMSRHFCYGYAMKIQPVNDRAQSSPN